MAKKKIRIKIKNPKKSPYKITLHKERKEFDREWGEALSASDKKKQKKAHEKYLKDITEAFSRNIESGDITLVPRMELPHETYFGIDISVPLPARAKAYVTDRIFGVERTSEYLLDFSKYRIMKEISTDKVLNKNIESFVIQKKGFFRWYLVGRLANIENARKFIIENVLLWGNTIKKNEYLR